MRRYLIWVAAVGAMGLGWVAHGQDVKAAAPAPAPVVAPAVDTAAEELAKESEAACVASAGTKPTPQVLMEKVNKACELIEKEGKAAFRKFKGKDSEFIFCGTYIFVIDMEGVTHVQPIKYKLEGTSSIGMKDTKGKRFFVEFIDICKAKGSGWSEYWWPKPGEKEGSLKASYLKKATFEGKDYVVGAGAYDISKENIEKALAGAAK